MRPVLLCELGEDYLTQATKSTTAQTVAPQCNVNGSVIDRHVWDGGVVCKRCGARKPVKRAEKGGTR